MQVEVDEVGRHAGRILVARTGTRRPLARAGGTYRGPDLRQLPRYFGGSAGDSSFQPPLTVVALHQVRRQRESFRQPRTSRHAASSVVPFGTSTVTLHLPE